jgi:hypothetical protein
MRRIVDIHWSPETIKFDSAEQLEAFQSALGRMILFGMTGDEDKNDVQLVQLFVDSHKEFTGIYRTPIERKDSYSENARLYRIDDAVEGIRTEGCFVLGGIPREGGKSYSFHS